MRWGRIIYGNNIEQSIAGAAPDDTCRPMMDVVGRPGCDQRLECASLRAPDASGVPEVTQLRVVRELFTSRKRTS